jgi:BolA protein
LTNRRQGRIAAAMTVKDAITNKLHEAFSPESLHVVDESHLHEGHSGHRPGGETHFRVNIVSPAFEGKSRIERHRMVNATLDAELKGSVHALAIKAQAPGETAGR